MGLRTGALALVLGLCGCTQEHIVLRDIWDGATADPGASTTGGLGGNDSVAEQTCAHAQGLHPLHFTQRSAEVTFLLDRSATMVPSLDGLRREEASVVAISMAMGLYPGLVKFGFAQFPAGPKERCTAGCCASKVVPPQLSAFQAMDGRLTCEGRSIFECPAADVPDSPSYAALAKLADYYVNRPKSEDSHGPRYAVLLTASEPSCVSADPGGDECALAMDQANLVVSQGVRIIVFSVGYAPPWNSCLRQLAAAGASLPAPVGTQLLFAPNGSPELYDIIRTLMSAIAKKSCIVEFTEGPPDQSQLVVSLTSNGATRRVKKSATDGWSFADANQTSLVLTGSACDSYAAPLLPAKSLAPATLSIGYYACTGP